MELTTEQKRALALAAARLRLEEDTSAQPASLVDQIPGGTEPYQGPAGPPPTTAEKIAAHPATRFAVGAASPILGLMQLGARNPIGRALGQDEWIDDKLATLKRMQEAGGHEGFDVAGTAGAIASPLSLLTLKMPVPATVPGRVVQGTGIGAGFGAVTPVDESENFKRAKAMQIGTGAALGTVIPAGVETLRAGARVGRNLIDPLLPGGIDRAVGRTANQAAGNKREAIIQALLRQRQLVPGSRPTAGEAATEAGSAEFAGLQRVVEGRRPSEYLERAAQQEAARRGALAGIGKDKATLEAARSARSAQAQHDYGEAGKLVVQADRTLGELMERPSMSKVIARARDLAREQGHNFEVRAAEPAKSGLIVGESGQPLTRTAAQPAEYPVESLHYMKMAMDDLIKNPERFGIGATEARAIAGTQKQFVQWLGEKAPAYDAARTAYAKASVPINRMEVGQELEKSLTSSLGTAERPAAFATAVREAPRTIKRATGQPRFDELSEVLDPQQMQTVGNVMADLQRGAQYEQLARAGTERARELVGQVAPTAPAAGMFNPKYSVARAIVNRLAGRVEGKSVDRLAEAMQDPQLMARIMQQASPAERRAIIEGLMLSRMAVIGATTGAARLEDN